MFKEMLRQLHVGIMLLFVMTVLTGILYPLLVTGIAQSLFSFQANGSLIKVHHKTVGSLYIGQFFSLPQYFWARPSATTPFPYNGASSSSANRGPSNVTFLDRIQARQAELKPFISPQFAVVPFDLMTTSASGLDPEISPAAALFQVPRIAKMRRISESELQALVMEQIISRTFGFIGEPRINVLRLNILLDELSANKDKDESPRKTPKS